mmetsp:Transcript_4350/g.5706  ORF Transcript_4350/g.5706 Transcript_4350/m.5706 type:complete len:197 (+) Transcript_4350:2-592(+)
MRSNCLEWNPMEPMNFVVGNEDYNSYTFDMRKLDKPTKIYKGHQGAVMCVGWSPTGREFATGSYDRTIRIFQHKQGTARDIYHTKRMQRVFTIHFTSDHKYLVSGSDDTNLRLWKAQASAQIGQKNSTRRICTAISSNSCQKVRTFTRSQTYIKISQNTQGHQETDCHCPNSKRKFRKETIKSYQTFKARYSGIQK